MKQPIEFGEYHLFERIAVGGMAEVFKAASYGVEGFERVIAVKRVLPQISEDQAFIDMFIDEAKIAVQLEHPNIGRIYDLGNAEGSYFIAMEYVSGRDARALYDRLKKLRKQLDVALCCHIIKEVCEALEYAHSKTNTQGEPLSLIHRDVSPQNILLGYDGQVKLIDFGIAKAAGKATKTKSGILKGKFGYMSPEHVRGRPIDHRSDLFALAIVLYELLTGERCFIGKDDFSTLEKVRRVEFRPVRELNRAVPPELERIVMKGLAKSPKSRYQSASELQEALQTFLYQTGSFVSRKQLATLMAELFSPEIEHERTSLTRFRKYARAHIPEATRASSLDDLLAGSAINLAPTEKLVPPQEKPAPRLPAVNAPIDPSSKPTEKLDGPATSAPSIVDRPTVKTVGRDEQKPLHSTPLQPTRSRRRLLKFLGLTLASIALLLLIVSRSQELSPGQIEVTSDPASVTLYVDSEKVFEGKTPVTLNNIVPNERYLISVTSTGFDPQEHEVILKDGETQQLRVAMMPSAQQTHLNLSTIPSNAVVIMDGKPIGRSPLKLRGLPSGRKRVEYRLDGVLVKSETLDLALGTPLNHELILPPASIRVYVNVFPKVSLEAQLRKRDGSLIELASLDNGFEVTNDGETELVINAKGFESEVRKLQSNAKNLNLEVKLTPVTTTLKSTAPNSRRVTSTRRERDNANDTDETSAQRPRTESALTYGFVSVHSFPPAECFIDGRPMGMTPVYRQKVPVGVHAIMLQRSTTPSFTKTVRVTVAPDKEEKLVHKQPN